MCTRSAVIINVYCCSFSDNKTEAKKAAMFEISNGELKDHAALLTS